MACNAIHVRHSQGTVMHPDYFMPPLLTDAVSASAAAPASALILTGCSRWHALGSPQQQHQHSPGRPLPELHPAGLSPGAPPQETLGPCQQAPRRYVNELHRTALYSNAVLFFMVLYCGALDCRALQFTPFSTLLLYRSV